MSNNEKTDVEHNYVELQQKHTELEQRYADLEKKYVDLKQKHTDLEKVHSELEYEFSENVIVQSMNDMKQKYEQIQKNTVPLYKYQLINEKYKTFVKNFSGCIVLTEHITKVLRQIEPNEYNRDRKNLICKAELELLTLKEILEDTLSTNERS